MFYLLVLLSLVLSIYSDDLTLAVTENDPSSLVEGVSVITGDLYALEDDYVIQGAEPIRLRRSFISRDGVFKGYQHLTATFACTINQLFGKEHNGTTLFYYTASKNQIPSQIGGEF